MQVGVVAERLGLSIRTLHHWEEMGLVTPSARSAGGFRLYTEDDVTRLVTIRRMKPLGFTLDEMKGLLDAIDTMDDRSANDQSVEEARAFIAECHGRAETRCRDLRERLSWAEEFRDGLARRVRH